MRTLFLCEKPSAARKLEPHTAAGDIVLAAEGHLLEPKEPDEIDEAWKRWTFDDLPIIVDPIPLKIGRSRSGKSHKPKIDAIAAALKKVDRVCIATDAGREGSLIAWEILVWLKWSGTVCRLRLGALDDTSIRRAFAEMAADPQSGDHDYACYLEALCRQHEDWHGGFNGTRLACLRLRPADVREVWSMGGVQTPTLALLAQHERRIVDFRPIEHFKVRMPVRTVQGGQIVLVHAPPAPALLTDRAAAETLRTAAAAWQGPLAVRQDEVRRRPPALHSKDSLVRRCAKMWGWDPDRTAAALQAAYDAGYLTYPRTESRYLPESQAGEAAAVLAAIVQAVPQLAPVIPVEPAIRRGTKHGVYVPDPGEHHAIIPTASPPAAGALSGDAADIYAYLARCFVAAHLPDACDAQTVVTADVAGHLFRAAGTVQQAPGWRVAFGTAQGQAAETEERSLPGGAIAEDESDEKSGGSLPPLCDGEPVQAQGAELVTAMTKPPKRITRGELATVMGRLIDLVDDPQLRASLENPANPLEPKGLGTTASRDAILPKLLRSGYVELLRGTDPPIRVTAAGLALIEVCRRIHPDYASPVGRAVFESTLAGIGRLGDRRAVAAAASFRRRTAERMRALVAAARDIPSVVLPPETGATPAPPRTAGGGKHRSGGRRGEPGRASTATARRRRT